MWIDVSVDRKKGLSTAYPHFVDKSNIGRKFDIYRDFRFFQLLIIHLSTIRYINISTIKQTGRMYHGINGFSHIMDGHAGRT